MTVSDCSRRPGNGGLKMPMNTEILEVGGDGGNRTRAAFPEQNLSKTGVDRRAGGGYRIGREVVA